MLRSPLEALSAHRMHTAGVVLALAAALWLGAALAASAIQLQTGADGWWEEFLPVVYLDPGVGSEVSTALAEEIEGWSQVDEVTIEGPDKAMARLTEHLGEDEVRQMGVEESMMPASLVVYPHLWHPGQVEVIANAEALEVRDEVVAVDVPQARSLRWLDRGRNVFFGLALVVVLALLSSLMAMGSFLRRLQSRERRENHLLEVFGASKYGLRRSALWRGMALGAVAGLMAGFGFLPWALMLDELVVEIAHQGAFSPLRSGIWSCVLLAAGLVIGAVVGWFGGRPPSNEVSRGLDSMLDWEREAL